MTRRAIVGLWGLLLAFTATTTTAFADQLRFNETQGGLQWLPLSHTTTGSFFQRPRFSMEPHLDRLKERHMRRLTMAEPERRLTVSECIADLKKMGGDFDTKFRRTSLEALNKLLTASTIDVPSIIKSLPDLGTKIREFDFGKLGKSLGVGLVGVSIVLEGVSLTKEVQQMMEDAREVINTIREIEKVVRRIGDQVLELMERSDFNHFISAASASAVIVLDMGVDTSDKLFAVCRGFDYTQITQLTGTMQNFRLCTKETDETKLIKCKLAIGIAAAGALLESLVAASVCDSHVAISQSHSSHPIATLKVEAERFIHSLMSSLPAGNETAAEWKDSYDTIKNYGDNITEVANQAAPIDDPNSADKYVEEVLADLHSRTLGSVAAIRNYTASDVYRNMTATNPDAGAAGQIVGLALGKAQEKIVDKLGGLQDKVIDQHNERMVLYDTINNTLWTNHAEFMGQVDHMGTLFTEQHTERMGRLNGVQSSLSNIQSSTSSGFSQLRSRIQDMGRKFVSQVQGIEQNVVATGAATTSFLSNAVMDANKEIENRINGVGDTVVRNHEMIMSAIGDAQQTAVNEFTSTQNLLYSASDSFRQTIDNGLTLVADTATSTYNQINDVVYKRMEESHTILDQIMTGMSSDFALIDDKLVILENRARNMSYQLDIAKQFLVSIHLQYDKIQQMLDDLPTAVQQEMFQSDVDGLHRKYQNMRKVYRDYLESDLPVKTIAESCEAFQIYDLFLRFLRILDVSDEEMPRQLENFNFDRASYEQFGVTVLGVLNDLSFFDGICAKAQFSATMKDLEEKAKEQADEILRVSSKLAHQVEDVIPALVLAHRVPTRLAQLSSLSWGSEGMQTVEDLRAEFQKALGDYAMVTVLHAGTDGQLLIDHLDRDTSLEKPRRSGVILSEDQKLAVIWSHTKQIAADKMLQANQTELLRQGVYRGNLTSTSQGCFLASSSDDYYPSCSKCSCVHYEDFASLEDPMAGRAVTYLAEKSFDSDFVVETVFSADVDYALHVIQLNVGSLSGTLATAGIQAPVIALPATSAVPLPSTTTLDGLFTLWEGVSSSGRFDVVPSDIKGTVISTNELTVSVTSGGKLFHRTFSLFCDGRVKLVDVPESDFKLQYACSQAQRATSAKAKDGYPHLSSGLPVQRLERAVCAAGANLKFCRAKGAVDIVQAGTHLEFGALVDDVTLFTSRVFDDTFTICRHCAPETLNTLTTTYAFTSAFIGIPNAPPEMFNIECAESARSEPEKLLVCRPQASA